MIKAILALPLRFWLLSFAIWTAAAILLVVLFVHWPSLAASRWFLAGFLAVMFAIALGLRRFAKPGAPS